MIGRQLSLRLSGDRRWLGRFEDADPLIQAAVPAVEVGRFLVVGLPQKDQFGTGNIIRHGRRVGPPAAGKGRLQAIGRCDQLRPGVLEQR